jgi:hypothetical protein
MAPEQARGRRTTPATDVYSVGIVLYEMLAGRPPFTERSAVELALRHLAERPEPLPPGTPPALAEIVNRALAKDPAERYADGREMADALGAARPRALVSAAAAVASGGGASPGPTRRPVTAGGSGGRDGAPAPTRRAPRRYPRRNLNPAARRRSIAALSLAFLLLGAMIVTALVLGATAHVRVPSLLRMTRSQVRGATRRVALDPSFSSRYAPAAQGTVIAQAPGAGRRVREGTAVRVVLSAGPPPVKVPQLAGEPVSQAQAELHTIGLGSRVAVIAAPGVPAGTVTSQSPAPGTELTPSRRVALNVAETPHWQPVTSLAGSGQVTTVRFHVRGTRWRVVYTMSYQGTCTFVVFCSGPGAQVDNTVTGSQLPGFSLSDGGRQTRVFDTGPGDYRLAVSPGSDTARWSMYVEDYY